MHACLIAFHKVTDESSVTYRAPMGDPQRTHSKVGLSASYTETRDDSNPASDGMVLTQLDHYKTTKPNWILSSSALKCHYMNLWSRCHFNSATFLAHLSCWLVLTVMRGMFFLPWYPDISALMAVMVPDARLEKRRPAAQWHPPPSAQNNPDAMEEGFQTILRRFLKVNGKISPVFQMTGSSLLFRRSGRTLQTDTDGDLHGQSHRACATPHPDPHTHARALTHTSSYMQDKIH